jgi:hypothetical protein
VFAVLRVIIVEWILARLALRWVLTIGVLAIGGLIFFIGLPTLLIVVALVLGWRWFKGAEARAQNQPTRPSSPA